MALEQVPYTNFHDLNLDWVLKVAKQAQDVIESDRTEINTLIEQMEQAVTDSAASAEAASTSAQSANTSSVNAAFEANRAATAAEGATATYEQTQALYDDLSQTISGDVESWLEDNVSPSTGYVIDDSLTIQGAAADAKAVGDRLDEIETEVSSIELGVEMIPIEIARVSSSLADSFDTLNPNTAYDIGDTVTVDNRLYLCVKPTTGGTFDATAWQPFELAPAVINNVRAAFQRVDLFPPMFISRAKRSAAGTVIDGTGCVTSAIRVILDSAEDKDIILVATNKSGFQIYDIAAGAFANTDYVHNNYFHFHGREFYLTLHNSDNERFTPAMLQDIYFLAPADVANYLRYMSAGFECEITNTQPMTPNYSTDYGRGYYIPRYGVYTSADELGFLQRNQTAIRPTTAALFCKQDLTILVGRDESADKIVTCTLCLFTDTPSAVTLTSGMMYTIPANTRFSLTFSETGGTNTNNCQRYTVMIVKDTVPMLYDTQTTALSVAHPALFDCDAAFMTGNLLWALAKGNTVDPPRYWVRDLTTNTMLVSAADAGHTFGHCNNVNYDPVSGNAYVSDWTDGNVIHVFAVDTTAHTMTYVEDITIAAHTGGSADFSIANGEAFYVGWTTGSSATTPNTLSYGLYVADEAGAYIPAWDRKAVRPRIMQGMTVLDSVIRYVACDWSANNFHTLSVNDIDLASGRTITHAVTGEIASVEGEAIIPFDNYTSMVVSASGNMYIVLITP